MKESTKTAIAAILAADDTMTETEINRFLLAAKQKENPIESRSPMTRQEVATALRCSLGSVTNFANRGLIGRIKGFGGRGVRYCREDVLRVLKGYVPISEDGNGKGYATAKGGRAKKAG